MSHRRHLHHEEASLEILTDGSEHTGGPAIFLTIRRYSNWHGHSRQQQQQQQEKCGDYYYQQDDMVEKEEGAILARYNLTGLPSLTGRLSSDQSFKLLSGGAFRAVFLPSLVTAGSGGGGRGGRKSTTTATIRGASVGGLSALFLNLIQSGYKVASRSMAGVAKGGTIIATDAAVDGGGEFSSDSAPETNHENDNYNHRDNSKPCFDDVSIIGPHGTNEIIDGILDTLFGTNGRRNRPSLRVCEVPSPDKEDNGDGGSNTCCWWEVYSDSYIRVWAQSVPNHELNSACLCDSCEVAKHGLNANNSKNSLQSSSASSSSSSSSSDDEDSISSDDDESVSSECEIDSSSNSSASNNNTTKSKTTTAHKKENFDAAVLNNTSSVKNSNCSAQKLATQNKKLDSTGSINLCNDGDMNSGDTGGYSLVHIVMIRPQLSARDDPHNGSDRKRKRSQQTKNNGIQHEIEGQCRCPYIFAIMPAPIPQPAVSSSLPDYNDRKHQTCQSCGTTFQRNIKCSRMSHHWNVFRNLPQEILSRTDGSVDEFACNRKEHTHSSLLDFILHLDPLVGDCCDKNENRKSNDSYFDIGEAETKQHESNVIDSGIQQQEDSSPTKKVAQYTIPIPLWTISAKLTDRHMATFPDGHLNHYNDTGDHVHKPGVDAGILIRAQHRSKLLCRALPFAFPFMENFCVSNNDLISMPTETVHERQPKQTPKNGKFDDGSNGIKFCSERFAVAFGLRSCTSVLLNGATTCLNNGSYENIPPSEGNTDCEYAKPSIMRKEKEATRLVPCLPFTFVSRIESILERCKSNSFVSWDKLKVSGAMSESCVEGGDENAASSFEMLDYPKLVRSLECAYYGKSCFCDTCNGEQNTHGGVVGNEKIYSGGTMLQTQPTVKNDMTLADNNEIDLDSSSESGLSQELDGDPNELDIECESVGDGPSKVNKQNDIHSSTKLPSVEYPNHRHPVHLDSSSPHLLVLGTGCATPAPMRGSSAYGLMLPTTASGAEASETTTVHRNKLVLSAIIECGEGTLTSLLRYLPTIRCDHSADSSPFYLDVQLGHVGFIWISHGHLDHYGDLPSVVQAIMSAKKNLYRDKSHHCHQNKKNSGPLVVIASSKVLTFLGTVMNAQVVLETKANNPQNLNGSSLQHGHKSTDYVGVTHREFQFSPFAEHIRTMVYEYSLLSPDHNQPYSGNTIYYNPFASLRSIDVEHCQEAYALILELRFSCREQNIRALTSNTPRHAGSSDDNASTFVLCFSGDTRPSAQLVHGCRSHSPSMSRAQLMHQRQFYQSSFPPPPPPITSLLIHEATFVDNSQGRVDALRKRHSTTSEALDIASQIKAKGCLLTHFSQRYQHVSIGDSMNKLDDDLNNASKHSTGSTPSMSNPRPFSWGIALDGMMIPLTNRCISSLFQLSQCVDALISLNSENQS